MQIDMREGYKWEFIQFWRGNGEETIFIGRAYFSLNCQGWVEVMEAQKQHVGP